MDTDATKSRFHTSEKPDDTVASPGREHWANPSVWVTEPAMPVESPVFPTLRARRNGQPPLPAQVHLGPGQSSRILASF